MNTLRVIAILSLLVSPATTVFGQPARTCVASPRYDMVVRILPDARRLEVNGTITIPAASEARDSIRIALSKSFPNLRLEPIEPAEILGSVQLKEAWQSPYVTTWDVALAHTLPAETSAVFRFSYAGGETPGDVLYVSEKGAYASGSSAVWYPEILLPVVNNPPVVGTVRYAVPEAYTLVASGKESTTPKVGQLR